MALSRRSGGRSEVNTWPGFVDAMTALLMILMFVMSIFMIVQFTMQEKLTGQTKQLDDLNRQLAGLADVLALERDRSAALEGQVGELKSSLGRQTGEVDRLTAALAAMTQRAQTGEAEVDRLNAAMAALSQSRDAATARADELEKALAETRTEMDAAAEQARLAAARREALEAMVADLQARDAERVNALNLLAELQKDKEALTQEKSALAQQVAALMQKGEEAEAAIKRLTELEAKLSDEEKARLAEAAAAEELRKQLDSVTARLSDEEKARLASVANADDLRARLAELEKSLTDNEKQRLAEAAAVEELRRKLADTQASLTDEEKARLAEAAAAEALRQKLAKSDAELDAMTLALEKARKEAEDTLTLLAAANAAKAALESQLTDGGAAIDREAALRKAAEAELAKVKEQTLEEQKRVALLNAQVRELRDQLGGLQALLDDYEKRDSDAQVQIARLGERLNAALAQKVGELAGLRSVFFEKMEKVLGGRKDIQRVGDRFVFQSEVLFAPGSAELGADGREQLAKLGEVLREVSGEMPEDLNWILRVDGHTDKVPISRGGRYRDNWELSQARALSVVRFLIEREGVPPGRLAAAGFGEYQPIDPGDSPEALAKNRRIEFKFTER